MVPKILEKHFQRSLMVLDKTTTAHAQQLPPGPLSNVTISSNNATIFTVKYDKPGTSFAQNQSVNQSILIDDDKPQRDKVHMLT